MPLKFRISIYFLLFCQFTWAQPEAFLKGPFQIRPGIGASIELTVYREGMTGPVRYEQQLPRGWTATELPVFNANLHVEQGRMRIIWLDFPLKDTVRLSFELKPPINESTGNSFQLAGLLEYFEGATPKKVTVKPHTVKTVRYFSRFQ